MITPLLQLVKRNANFKDRLIRFLKVIQIRYNLNEVNKHGSDRKRTIKRFKR